MQKLINTKKLVVNSCFLMVDIAAFIDAGLKGSILVVQATPELVLGYRSGRFKELVWI